MQTEIEKPEPLRGLSVMNLYRFVHLSDIHFGQERHGTLVLHNEVRETLLKDCAAMRTQVGQAHGILVAGDIAYAGKRDEYKRATDWLERLTEAVGCSQTAVYVVPGNHDIDLDEIGHLGKMVHDKIREGSPTSIQADLEGISKGNEASNPLLPKLKAYREFAEQYGCDFESAARPSWQKNFSFGRQHTLCLLGLNTVQVSNKQDLRGNMVLGNTQYIIPQPADVEVEHVVMLHHPLEWFKDRVEAEQWLYSRARVIMVGHEHIPAIQKILHENKNERLMIASGATNPPETGGRYRYTYNWLEFRLQATDAVPDLVVKVYPRIWVEEHTMFMPDHARLGGDESREFPLACPNFKSQLIQHEPAGAAPAAKAPERITTEGVAPMVGEHDERFARLRYFFWRFLDWRQRLSVLVQLDVLPNTPERPMPQTMERLALNSARAQKKLDKLWAAVMELVPEDKREDNPFTQGPE